MAATEVQRISARKVKLRVLGLPWMENYHGAEARIIGDAVDALELTNDGHVAFVDDRDGVASELFENWRTAPDRPDPEDEAAVNPRENAKNALMGYARARFLHGHVLGVRT